MKIHLVLICLIGKTVEYFFMLFIAVLFFEFLKWTCLRVIYCMNRIWPKMIVLESTNGIFFQNLYEILFDNMVSVYFFRHVFGLSRDGLKVDR